MPKIVKRVVGLYRCVYYLVGAVAGYTNTYEDPEHDYWFNDKERGFDSSDEDI